LTPINNVGAFITAGIALADVARGILNAVLESVGSPTIRRDLLEQLLEMEGGEAYVEEGEGRILRIEGGGDTTGSSNTIEGTRKLLRQAIQDKVADVIGKNEHQSRRKLQVPVTVVAEEGEVYYSVTSREVPCDPPVSGIQCYNSNIDLNSVSSKDQGIKITNEILSGKFENDVSKQLNNPSTCEVRFDDVNPTFPSCSSFNNSDKSCPAGSECYIYECRFKCKGSGECNFGETCGASSGVCYVEGSTCPAPNDTAVCPKEKKCGIEWECYNDGDGDGTCGLPCENDSDCCAPFNTCQLASNQVKYCETVNTDAPTKAPEPTDSPTKKPDKLCDPVDPGFDSFCGAAETLGLLDEIETARWEQGTLFTPTNQAFAKFEAELKELSNMEVKDILNIHVLVNGVFLSAEELICSRSYRTFNGDSSTFCTVQEKNDVLEVKDRYQKGPGNELFGLFPRMIVPKQTSVKTVGTKLLQVIPVDNLIFPMKEAQTVMALMATVAPTEFPTDAPVSEPTERPVDPTEAPVDPTSAPVDPTDAPVVDPTSAPVDPTEAPVVNPTSAPVDPTETPIVDPTSAPVDPTEAPVVDPTLAPVDPTEAPVVDPTSAPVDATEAPVDPTSAPVDATEAPVTDDPTETPVTDNPTETPVTDAPTASV
jgi:hypothetical protein